MTKTTLAGLAAGTILTLGAAGPALAEFPEKPIRIVAGFGAGGATDTAARIIAAGMSDALGEQVYVENMPGNSTNIAAVEVKNSDPDGYTLFIAGNSNAVNPALRDDVPVDILNDFTPIAPWAQVPNVLAVTPSLDVHSLEELIALAKNSPDGLFYGSSGIGAVSHLAGAYLANATGANLIHIPYQGSSAAMTDLLSGEIQLMFVARSTVEPYIESGDVIALATSTRERPKGLEDLPTVSEAGIEGFEATIWFGLVAPAGTPDDVVQTLAAAVDTTLNDEDVQAQLATQGIEVFHGDGEAYWDFMQSEMTKWAEIVESAGITVE